MPSKLGHVKDLLAAASAAEHITQDNKFEDEDDFDIVENINGQGGTANDMEGGEHVGHLRGKGYDDGDANVAEAYYDKDAEQGEGKDTSAAAPTNDDEEIVEGAGEVNNLPPLGDQFMK